MSPDDPRHGTPAGATAHYRAGQHACAACAKAKRRRAIEAELDAMAGNPRRAPLGRRAHAVILRTPKAALVEASGITGPMLARLEREGPDSIVIAATRERLLRAGAQHFWTPTGVQRRLRALMAIGWSMNALAIELDIWPDHLRRIANHDPQFVRRSFGDLLVAAYDRLSMTVREGRGASRARNTALRHGWSPPLAWDELDIDDPECRPAAVDDAPVRGQKGWTAVLLEDAEWLADAGVTLTVALERLEMRQDTFREGCTRAGRADIYWRLARREPNGEERYETSVAIRRAQGDAA